MWKGEHFVDVLCADRAHHYSIEAYGDPGAVRQTMRERG
jgi:hypothetical protein